MKNPANNIFKRRDFDIKIFILRKTDKIKRTTKAIDILYHTNDNESIDIKEPKIAVNPKMNTIK